MLRTWTKPAVLGGLCLLVAACAEPADESAMVPRSIVPVAASNPYAGSVSRVTGYGGEETNPMWTSEISKDDFQAALQTSLQQAGIYAPNGRYSLRADILSVKQPIVGFDLNVSMTVRYNLIDATGRVRFDKTITATYHAEFSEAFLGVERLRKANEGAARENIGLFLRALGAQAPGSSIGAIS